MNLSPVHGCLWAADNLLVRTRRAAKLALPQVLLKAAFDAGVACVVNLVSKAEYLESCADTPVGPLAEQRDVRSRRPQPKVAMFYEFWPEPGELPSARQVRQATDFIEDAHGIGLRVLVNGVGHPARAALVAGCWLARQGHDGARRLGWLEPESTPGTVSAPSFALNAAERTFVAEWPTGREGQPELADMEWSDQDEVFPFASVEHLLRVLPTVRVYTTARSRAGFMNVPVLDGQRVSDGADIAVDVEELRRGTWIGERTLRLPNGWQVVFVSPRR